MIPQCFKGDATELKVDECGSEITELISGSLDQFLDQGFITAEFLLMLYDEGRMPFSDRIPRDAFVGFLVECLANANFIGTYDSYIFLVQAIFGEDSEIQFGDPVPGFLSMQISSTNTLEFEFSVREIVGGSYEHFEIIDESGNNIVFSGFGGIETEDEFLKLLSEFTPAGIYSEISFVPFTTSQFLVVDGGSFTIVDDLGNNIIFFELGG